MRSQWNVAAITLGLLLSPVLITLSADDQPPLEKDPEATIKESLEKLPEADRKLAEVQRYCATETTSRLGSMGVPIKLEISGKSVFVCCGDCKQAALADPKATLAQVEKLKKIATAMGKLTPEDRTLAEKQAFCAVQTKNRLGSMGAPIKLAIKGEPVFLCCAGCKSKALASPDKTLEQARTLRNPKPQEKE